jgi:glycosyltransferase involved in cell wall biosynthesis
MLSICFVAVVGDLNSGSTRGVAEKVGAQVAALDRLGYDVHGFFGVSGGSDVVNFPACTTLIPFDMSRSFALRKLGFLKRVLEEIGSSRPDILYFRYPLAGPSLLWFLKRIRCLSPNTQVVLERQSKELPELLTRPSIPNYIKLATEFLFRNQIQRAADCNVCVTEEIADYIKAYYPKASCITSGNGISSTLGRKPAVLLKPSSDTIRIVFVGNLTPWCGVDRIIRILALRNFQHYKHNIVFSVVGEGVIQDRLREQAKPHGGSVRFYGHLAGDELAHVISSHDIAVGAFNNDLRKLKEGSNLKLRLYCSLGVPFAFAEKDSDFPSHVAASEYFCCINAHLEDELGMILLDFALKMKKRPEASASLRNYANASLVWEKKFERLIREILKLKCSNGRATHDCS